MTASEMVGAITAIIAACGGGYAIPKIIDGIRAHYNNRAKQEQQENRSLLGRAKYAEQRADREAEFRRRVEEWGGRLAYMLAQLGVPADKIPSKPERDRTKELSR